MNIVDFVLSRTSVSRLNSGLKEYSTQRIYSAQKNALKTAFPEEMPTDLHYSVKTKEAFKEFEVDEIWCKEEERNLIKMRKHAVSRYLPAKRKQEVRKEYNERVRAFNKAIEPQAKLIKRWKKLNAS